MTKTAFSILLALLLGMAVSAAAEPDRCRLPDELAETGAHLPILASAIRAGRPARIAVLGTSSSLATSTRGLAVSYAAALPEALAKAFPGQVFEIHNHAAPNQNSVEMARRISSEIPPLKPDLVIWQTGMVDAGQNLDPHLFATALAEGIQSIRRAGSDVILVAPQYLAHLEQIRSPAAFDGLMAFAADAEDASVFRRYDMMRHWAMAGAFRLSTSDRDLQRQEGTLLNACLAQHLAAMLRRGVGLGRP